MRILTLVLIAALVAASSPAQQRLEVVVLEGHNVSNSLQGKRAHDVTVQVRDQSKNPVDGAHVSLMLPERGVGGSFLGGHTISTGRTGGDGTVRFRGIRLRPLTGEFPIRLVAAHNGATASATATQRVENTPAPPQGRYNARNIAIIAIAAAGVAAAVAAAVVDTEKRPNSTSFGATPGSPVVTGPR